MRFFVLSLAIVAASTLSLASPVLLPVAARQLGVPPTSNPPGTSWGPTWTDKSLLQPTAFDAIAGEGCSYTINFKRDVRDTKYRLSYQSVFGIGDLQLSQNEIPSSFGYTGQTDADGRRVYSAFIDDACSRFYNDKRPPRAFKVYLTQSDPDVRNFVSPTFA